MATKELAANRRKNMAAKLWEHKVLYLMLLPSLAVVLLTKYGPMFGMYMAFTDFKITGGPFLKSFFGADFVGLQWFRMFFQSGDFLRIMRNTLMTAVLSLLFSFPAPILLALALNEVRISAVKRVVQTMSYLPYFISWVIVANIFITLLSGNGAVNSALKALGVIDDSVLFFQEGKYFWYIMAIANMWKDMGYRGVMYLAAITGIPPEQYESARVDGAGRWKLIWYVTLPNLKQTIVILLILAVGQLIMSAGFEQQMLMQNDTVRDMSDVIDTYVYRYGINNMMFSYASAVGVFKSVISFILVLSANSISKKLTETSLF